MEPAVIRELTSLVAVLFCGAAALVPIIAVSMRLGLKPLVEARERIRLGSATDLAQDRRIALLEAELQSVQGALQQMQEAEDFRRQLTS